jgi:hypothetical protein
MSEKIEGTFRLDGLLKGPLPALPAAEARMREWVVFARSGGLNFSLNVEGGAFDLMPDEAAVPAERVGVRPHETAAETLGQFIGLFLPAQRAALSCSLRSIEYRHGCEVQAVYLIAPDGRVDPRSRTVDADTSPPPAPSLERRRKVRLALIGLAAAAAILAIAWPLGLNRVAADLWADFAPLAPGEMAIDAAAFDGFFTAEVKSVARGNRSVEVVLHRGPRYPMTAGDIDKLYAAAASVPQRLAVDTLARGYATCEMFSAEGQFQGFKIARIQELAEKDMVLVRIDIQPNPPTRKIVIRY